MAASAGAAAAAAASPAGAAAGQGGISFQTALTQIKGELDRKQLRYGVLTNDDSARITMLFGPNQPRVCVIRVGKENSSVQIVVKPRFRCDEQTRNEVANFITQINTKFIQGCWTMDPEDGDMLCRVAFSWAGVDDIAAVFSSHLDTVQSMFVRHIDELQRVARGEMAGGDAWMRLQLREAMGPLFPM
jgi:hypothetical protein